MLTVRVRPGASRTHVGGRYGDGALTLVVAVQARAVEGAATEAVRKAVAAAFGVRTADVRLVRGAQSRTKTLAIAGEERVLNARLIELLDT